MSSIAEVLMQLRWRRYDSALKNLFMRNDKSRHGHKIKNRGKRVLNHGIGVGKPTLAMQQWAELKTEYPDYLLFFQLGDFYEIFHEDAIKAASLLDITLTKRGNETPMCGVPIWSYERHLFRLVQKNVKVAVCSQVGKPSDTSTKIFTRKMTRLATPGTMTEDAFLQSNEHNFLLAIAKVEDEYGVARMDVSTGELFMTSLGKDETELKNNLASYHATEILVPTSILLESSASDLFGTDRDMLICKVLGDCLVTDCEDYLFSMDKLDTKKVWTLTQSVGHVGDDEKVPEMVRKLSVKGSTAAEKSAMAGLLRYVQNAQCGVMPALSVSRLDFLAGREMFIDPAAFRNLEITRTYAGERFGTLLHTIDETVTNAGGRMLLDRISCPLVNRVEINQRLEAVDFFRRSPRARKETRDLLKLCGDLKRLVQRCCVRRAHGDDLILIWETIQHTKRLHQLLLEIVKEEHVDDEDDRFLKGNEIGMVLRTAAIAIKELEPTVDELYRALIDGAPSSTEDGNEYNKSSGSGSGIASGVIVPGYCAKLDEARKRRDHGRGTFEAMGKQYQEEMARLNPTEKVSLKIRLNRTYGYCIEIPKRFVEKCEVPDSFVKLQELKSVARYKTQDLIHEEAEHSIAAVKCDALEEKILEDLFQQVEQAATKFFEVGTSLAKIDVNAALGKLAFEKYLTRPYIVEEPVFDIELGRHLVVENNHANHEDGLFRAFIGNSLILDGRAIAKDLSLWLVTGPNMGGKSTFLRQNAHIAVLAQTGCFVPAERATVGIVDRVFCRVGASDNLVADRSTFMMEMEEASRFLLHATEQSLVIVDEIGRGTSTREGRAIAQAILEELLKKRCRTLFATHFAYELGRLPGFQKYMMAVRGEDEHVEFLHKVVPGVAEQSFGVHVARLARVPNSVIERADALLDDDSGENAKISFEGKSILQVYETLSTTDIESLERSTMISLLKAYRNYLKKLVDP